MCAATRRVVPRAPAAAVGWLTWQGARGSGGGERESCVRLCVCVAEERERELCEWYSNWFHTWFWRVVEVAPALGVFSASTPPRDHANVLRSLIESILQALQRDDVKAIIVTGANGKFCGGFDLNALDELQEGKAGPRLIRTLSNIMETKSKPLVAAIDGPALGAGLEVAMACNARIATSAAQLSLPELQFGIIPGGGGTQRLPRLVGLRKALEMLLTSKLIHGEEAHKFGLVDAIVSGDELLENARQMALDILASGKPLVSSLKKTDKIEPLGKAREILNQARGQAPSLQHSQVCLDVIEEGIVSGPDAGLSKEREEFQILLKSDTCKSMVNDFIAGRGARKSSPLDQARSRL